MPRRTYTPDEKANACELYVKHGPREASRQTGIPLQTIAAWAKRTGLAAEVAHVNVERIEQSQQRQKALREELRRLLLENAVEMCMRVREPHVAYLGKDIERVEMARPPAEACAKYAVAAAVFLDKYRLEVGEVTSRQAFEGVDPRESALRHLDELAARRERQAS